MKVHLDEMMKKYEINSCLKGLYIKLLALITDTKDPAQLQLLAEVLKKNAYSDQLELVRVSTVKSVSRIAEKLVEVPQDFYKTCVLLLNDEHPEIRSYLVQSLGARKLFCETNNIKSPMLIEKAPMLVDLNETTMVEAVLSKVNNQTLVDMVV